MPPFAKRCPNWGIQFISAVISAKHIDICSDFYSYNRIGTDENSMKIKMWTVLLIASERLETTVRMKTTVSDMLG